MILNMKKQILIVLIIVFSALLTGCGNDELEEAQGFLTQVKRQSAKPIDPLPEVKSYHSVTYSALAMRSPFIEPITAIELMPDNINGVQPDLKRARGPLERYSLDSLQMVGTLNMTNTNWAILLDTDGVIHKIRQGDYLGRDYGNVIKIGDNHIDVVEIVPDSLGGWKQRDTKLVIGEK